MERDRWHAQAERLSLAPPITAAPSRRWWWWGGGRARAIPHKARLRPVRISGGGRDSCLSLV